ARSPDHGAAAIRSRNEGPRSRGVSSTRICGRTAAVRLHGTLLAVLLATGDSRPAQAVCNLIPQTTRTFSGALGTANRPFAAPGEPLEIALRPCDVASPGFTAN